MIRARNCRGVMAFCAPALLLAARRFYLREFVSGVPGCAGLISTRHGIFAIVLKCLPACVSGVPGCGTIYA